MCVYVLLQTGNVSLQDLDQVFSWEQGAAEPNRIITVTLLTGQHRAPLDWGPGRDYLEPGYVGLRCSGEDQVWQCVDIIINIPNIV